MIIITTRPSRRWAYELSILVQCFLLAKNKLNFDVFDLFFNINAKMFKYNYYFVTAFCTYFYFT